MVFYGFLAFCCCQNYTLICRASNGVYSNVTNIAVRVSQSNKYPPRFSQDEYPVSNIVEKDPSSVGTLITTVRPIVCCCCTGKKEVLT